MNCQQARIEISAGLDDADPPIGGGQVEDHLRSCAPCRQWQDLAHVVTRRVRLGAALPGPQVVPDVLTAIREDVRRRRVRRYWLAVARAVILAGALQVLATVPLLVMARDRASGSGRVHILGLVEAVIGASFFLGAIVVLWRERDQQGLDVVRVQVGTASDRPVESGESSIGEVA